MDIQEYNVPIEDRSVFAKFMAYIAQVDGEVTLDEKQAIDNLLIVWGLDESAIVQVYDVLENGSSLKDLSSEFKNKKSCYLLLQELVTLAHIDGTYDESEKKAVREIAFHCSISESRLEEIEQWVRDGIAWREQGLTLIIPEGE